MEQPAAAVEKEAQLSKIQKDKSKGKTNNDCTGMHSQT